MRRRIQFGATDRRRVRQWLANPPLHGGRTIVPMFERFREEWLRPALFFGNNPLSLAGGAITTASGVTMISYWLAELSGHLSDNPYLGIIFFLLLPGLFLLGLALIPVGIYLRRKKLQKAGEIPAAFPRIDLNDRVFRHGIDIVLVATIVNFLVVATASYHSAEYMDSPQFCGRSCHVMKPEYTAYQISPHSHVACVECHIGTGVEAYFSAKINGTKQLVEVTLHPLAPLAPKIIPNYPTPIPSPVTSLRPARYTCEGCHTPTRFDGDKSAGQVRVRRRRTEYRDADGADSAPGRRGFALASQRHSRGAPGPHRVHRHRSHAHHDSLGRTHQSRRLQIHLHRVGAQRRAAPGRAPRHGLHRLPQSRRAHLCHGRRRHQSRHGRRRHQSLAALHPQGGPGTAESPLRQPGGSKRADSAAARGLLSQPASRGAPAKGRAGSRTPGRSSTCSTARTSSRS